MREPVSSIPTQQPADAQKENHNPMTNQIRTLVVLLAVTASAFVAATTARADGGADSQSQLTDTSHQVADIQHKIADLRARGQSARAGKLTAAATCGYDEPTQVFNAWGDLAGYSLAPGGDLSDTSLWTFKHANVASDPNPLGNNALQFSQGDSEAVSPAMCVNLDNPTIRLFMKDIGGNGKAALKVDVLYEDLNGKAQHLTLAKLRAGSTWSPTVTIPIAVNLLSTASASGFTAVAFDFKAEGLQKNEVLELANLYVDPFLSR
jgi:hypothetical protein